jgi:hypothetical protein
MSLVKNGTKVMVVDYPRPGMVWYGTIVDSHGGMEVQYKVSLCLGLHLARAYRNIDWFKHDRIRLVKKSEYEEFENLMKTKELLDM